MFGRSRTNKSERTSSRKSHLGLGRLEGQCCFKSTVYRWRERTWLAILAHIRGRLISAETTICISCCLPNDMEKGKPNFGVGNGRHHFSLPPDASKFPMTSAYVFGFRGSTWNARLVIKQLQLWRHNSDRTVCKSRVLVVPFTIAILVQNLMPT